MVQNSSTQQGFIGAQVQRNFMLQCLHSIPRWAERLVVVFAKQRTVCVCVCALFTSPHDIGLALSNGCAI